MSARSHDPLRLDVEVAGADAAVLGGSWPLAELQRLEALDPGDSAAQWKASFERRTVHGAAPQVWLRLQAHAEVARECQRCLQPVRLALDVDRRFRFVASEEEAAQLDADSDDDVLATARRFDLRALVEDELLLALPLVPRHEACPQPLPVGEGSGAEPVAPPSPFAALASLKAGKGH